WSGHLEHVFPAASKRKVEHHAALPWQEAPAFMAKLREVEGIPARALEFAIICAARSGEARFAVWAEIGLSEAAWTLPPPRMKAGKEHRVPLSKRALEILRALPHHRGLVFPGRDAAVGESALGRVLRKLAPGVTVHGFRSSFRDWAGESTNFPHDICE